MNIKSCFQIAYVMKTHGLKGEVTLTLLPECPTLEGLNSVFLQVGTQLVPYFIESVSVKGTRAYVKLEGVNSVTAAAELKGMAIFIPKNRRPALEKGEFYTDEVIGFNVVDTNLGNLGTVKEVMETGVNKHLVILRDGHEILIPLNGPFIKGVNKGKSQIQVELPDGLVDL